MYSRCQKCGKKLTDPESIKRGYGRNVGEESQEYIFPKQRKTNRLTDR